MANTLRKVALLMPLLAACSPEPAKAPPFQTVAGRDACQGTAGYSATFDTRRTFLWRSDWLKAIKQEAEIAPSPAVAEIVRQANAALDHATYSVVAKSTVPPSGNKHDYYSIGTYWWPDPAEPDGLPYVRHDGEINPEVYSEKFDYTSLNAMSADVTALSLAHYFTGEERYAAHAAEMIRTWFLDPDTAMNPNLIFAQGVPGRSEGRPTGIIETIALIPVVESIGLLQGSASLPPDEVKDLQAWFKTYVTWMRESEAGVKEGESSNNHAIAYDLQVIDFALFASETEIAGEVATAFADRRLVPQVAADGSMPEELARARTLHYSLFTLGLVTQVATLSECVGIDLWRFKESDGGGMRTAVDFLAAYAGRERTWPHKETDGAAAWQEYQANLRSLLIQAAWAYDEESYATKADAYKAHRGRRLLDGVLPEFGH